MQERQLLTLHWCSVSEWGRERLSTCLLYKGCQYIRKWQCSTIVNILQFTVGYLNATIKRRIQNADLEIGPDGSSQTRRSPRVDGYGARFKLPRSSGTGFWMVLRPNRTVFPVHTRTAGGLPAPVANTNFYTTESVLTSGCCFISQRIWMIICIVLVILGRCIEIGKFGTGRRYMWIHRCGRQIDDLGTLSSGIVTGWDRWGAGKMWLRQSTSGRWRWTCSFASPPCLWNLCIVILPCKASGCVVLTKHSCISFHRSIQSSMPVKLNAPILLCLDRGVRFLDQIFRFLDSGPRKSIFGHFDNIQGQAHVGLFQLYPTSLPCHSSRHTETLQEISCCF